jgi:hypothetical protein
MFISARQLNLFIDTWGELQSHQLEVTLASSSLEVIQ